MQHFIYFLVKLLIESTVTFASILGGIGAFIAGITGLFAVFLAYKSFMKVENELKEQKDQITELANIAKGLTKQNELSEKRFELSV